MWFKEYRDYETDKPLIKEQVDPNHGIIGCEMHDLNGWGDTVHKTFPRKARGFFTTLMTHLFRGRRG